MTSQKWSLYVALVMGDHNQTQAARATGISQPTINRWLHETKRPTDAAQVAKFAQGYGRGVLEAFVAAEMLPLDEVQKSLSAQSLALLSDLDRTVKSGRRATPGEKREADAAARKALSAGQAKGADSGKSVRGANTRKRGSA